MTGLADHAFRIDVGRRLSRIREGLGLSRGEFAAALGIAPKTLEKYELGAREVSAFALAQLRRVYGADANWLLTGLGEDGAPTR